MRLFLTLLLLTIVARAANTEFYVQNTGSNLNAGSSTSNTALVTGTGGDWNSGTGVYTFAGATDLSGVSAGMFASVYNDGATEAVFVGRITAADDGADTITVSTTAKSGTAPTTSTADDRSIKVGGAWDGPSGTSWFPLGFVAGAMTNSSGDVVRVNIKTGTYGVSDDGPTNSNAGPVVWEGYTTTAGDGTAAMSYPLITGDADQNGTADTLPFIGWTISGARHEVRYLKFQKNGVDDPGPNADGDYMLRTTSGGTGAVFYRCKFDYTWRDALRTGAEGGYVIECEGNGCNVDAANTYGQFQAYASTYYLRCWAHHAFKEGDAGDPGFAFQAGAGQLVTYDSCVSSHNGGQGWWNVTGSPVLVMKNCIAYANGLAGIEFANISGVTATAYLENNIFAENGESGIKHLNTTWATRGMNNAFYSNTDGEVAQGISGMLVGSVTLTGDPFVSPGTTVGDFRLNATAGSGAACRQGGMGAFLFTSSAYSTGIVSTPDIGIETRGTVGSASFGGAGTVSFSAP